MIARLILVLLLSAAAVGIYYLLRQRHMRGIRPVPAASRPTLFYFWASHCAVCPTQGRYVDTVVGEWGDRLTVERVDAERQPEVTARFRVFTLPTTILVDGDGRARHVNYGLTDAHKLGQQIAQLGDRAPETGAITLPHVSEPA